MHFKEGKGKRKRKGKRGEREKGRNGSEEWASVCGKVVGNGMMGQRGGKIKEKGEKKGKNISYAFLWH
jgi:hypothetical protein